jgi:hypothetical protein
VPRPERLGAAAANGPEMAQRQVRGDPDQPAGDALATRPLFGAGPDAKKRLLLQVLNRRGIPDHHGKALAYHGRQTLVQAVECRRIALGDRQHQDFI